MGKTHQTVKDYHRYCPGQEQIRISDAICLGRRRSNFPKCKGCQFNDDREYVASIGNQTTAEPSPSEVEDAKRVRIDSLFRTADVRGAFPDQIDEEIAWRIGLAAAQFLRSELRGYDRSQPANSTVVVGRDMRHSSRELADALMEGLRSGGASVIDIGLTDTPQLYFAVNQLTCCGGVQVTGGGSAADINGFKVCGNKGRPVHEETGLGKIHRIARNTIRHMSAQTAKLGRADLTDAYKGFIRGFLRTPAARFNEEQPLRIVVDASNGMAGRWLPIIFEEIEWLEIVRLNFEHNGDFVHGADPLREENLTQLRDRVARSKAAMGVCFDGDADRLAVVDNDGELVWPDHLAALIARRLLRESPGASVIYDLRCSRSLPEEIRKCGGVPRRERRSAVKKVMTDARSCFAIEASGRYYFRDNWYCESGFIALAHLVNLLTESGQSMHDLAQPLRRYARAGLKRYRPGEPGTIIERLARRYASAKIDYLDGLTVSSEGWWFHVHSREHEPVLQLQLEAVDEETLKSKLSELASILGPPLED